MRLKLKKCYFFSDVKDYLGHVITPSLLQVAKKTKETICTLICPMNKTELRSYLGLCNVHGHFVSSFARNAAHLNKLLKNGKPAKFDLDEEGKTAVEE